MQDVMILNDEPMILRAWISVIGGNRALGFETPAQLMYYVKNRELNCNPVSIFILDRQGRRGYDVVEDRLVDKLKKYCPGANYLLSSVAHPLGDYVESFDLTLGDIPIDIESIEKMLENKKL